ncbi:MAG: NADH-quinone oxidoreductase subunit A [bacterium]
MTLEYGYVGLFLFTGVFLVLAAFATSWLLRPRRPSEEKLSTYECGEKPFGEARFQFNVRYYLFAVLFVVFDVEAAFLIPWAVLFRTLGWAGLLEVLIFLGLLGVAYAWAWRTGAMEWT